MIDTDAPAATTPTATSVAVMRVPANLDYSASVRDFALASLKNVGGFDATWAYRLQLVVDEVFMNAVRYGSSAESSVTITFDYAPHRVMITVEDEGMGPTRISPRDLELHVIAACRAADDQRRRGEKNFALSGRGLAQLVATWTDSVTFSDSPIGGIRVTLTKAL